MKVDISVPEVSVKISAPKVSAETGMPVARRWVERDAYEGPYSITPSASAQTLDTEDKRMTGDLVVGAIPADYVGPSVPTQGATTVTPTTSEQTAVASGKYTTGAVKVGPIPPEYIIPSGTLEITENDVGIDVSGYAAVDVAVPDSNFIVTIEWDDVNELWVPNKTLAEIGAAYSQGRTIITTTIDPQSFLAEGNYFAGFFSFGVFDTTLYRFTALVLESDGLPHVAFSYNLYDTSDATISGNGQLLSGVKAVGADGTVYTGNIPSKQSSDLTASGATVTVPAGHYASQATKSVASGTEGTPTATKGAVSNHAVTVTPSVTNTEGYISGGTKTGTGVQVTAAELESGTKNITQNGTGIDVTGYSAVDVAVPSGGATQHVIHFEFDDSTTANVNVYYDDSLIGTMITSYAPSPWTYNNKMVVEAQLDGVTWYEYSPIPIGVELIDYTAVSNDTAIDSTGAVITQEWYYTSDYTPVDPSMTFSYTAGTWFYIGVYDESHNVVRTIYAYSDGTVDPNDSNTSHGTLSGNKLTGAAYVRLCGTWYDSAHMSLIRTA